MELLWFELSASPFSRRLVCTLDSPVRAQVVAAHLTWTYGHLHMLVVFSNRSTLRNAHAPETSPSNLPPSQFLTQFVTTSLDAIFGSHWTSQVELQTSLSPRHEVACCVETGALKFSVETVVLLRLRASILARPLLSPQSTSNIFRV